MERRFWSIYQISWCTHPNFLWYAQIELSKAVLQVLYKNKISSSTTEPHYRHHNPSELCIQVYNEVTNTILDCTSAPRTVFIYYMLLWVGISNFLAETAHGGIYDNKVAFGNTPHIIQLKKYTFLDPV